MARLLIKILTIFVLLNSTTIFGGEPVKNKIVAFWNSDFYSDKNYISTRIHKSLESVLNHYGLFVEYIDIKKGVPKSLSSDTLGMVSWFSGLGIPNAVKLIDLLSNEVSKGKKLLLLGELGFLETDKHKKVSLKKINRLLKKIGIYYQDRFFSNPLLLDTRPIVSKSWVEFERDYRGEVTTLLGVKAISDKTKVWLKVENKTAKLISDVVTIHPGGAYVQAGYDIFENPITYKSQWRVNPFKLVEKLFNTTNKPVIDTTTKCGKRIAYIHIDGDGFINISKIDRKSLSGKIIIEKILKKYNYPTTASVVVAEIDPNILNNKRSLELAREMYKLPFVEIASHTYSHPLSWELEPSQEEINTYLPADRAEGHKGPIVAYDIPDYKMTYEVEVRKAIEWIDKYLAPKGKKTKILLWSGSTTPNLEAFEILDKMGGMLNMNGGDGRFDRIFNSYSNLSSLYRQVGKYIQVYTSNANENLYTNLWTGPFSGFSNLIETFERTESPIRIKPINVYYHFYSGEHISSVKALERIYDWVGANDPYFMYASDYSKLILSVKKSKVYQVNEKEFIIRENGSAKTVRIDQKNIYPDYDKSENVVGHRIINDSLYLSLGNKTETKIVLSYKQPTGPYVRSCSRGDISFRKLGKVSSFELKGKIGDSLTISHGTEDDLYVENLKAKVEVIKKEKERKLTKIIFEDGGHLRARVVSK